MDKFKISPNWDCVKNLEELIADSRFCFSDNGHHGKRPKIVLNTEVNGVDCVVVGYDRHGLMIVGDTKFGDNWGKTITNSSKDVEKFIEDFLISDGAADILN